jgi:UDP-N-acetylmuramyl pentapeptide phosphotransferase/UDP-N-acetylglucosamine-1-phosphate transferase
MMLTENRRFTLLACLLIFLYILTFLDHFYDTTPSASMVENKADKILKLGAAVGNQILTGTDNIIEWGTDHPALLVYLTVFYVAGIVCAFCELLMDGGQVTLDNKYSYLNYQLNLLYKMNLFPSNLLWS